MTRFSFRKGERLSGRIPVSELFQSGNSIYFPPFRISYLLLEDAPSPARVVITVPKRLFRKAVDRNRLKRRIREAYRLEKESFYRDLEMRGIRLNLAIQLIQKDMPGSGSLQESLRKGFGLLLRQLDNHISG